jgi:Tfp pilus assembly protein PilX
MNPFKSRRGVPPRSAPSHPCPTLVIRHSSLDIPRRKRRGGFALLITITLLAFLVLLLVSLASLTRVETQVASNNQSISQARQNALMALNLALGQLQRHTGPDQRVTATADLQPLATEAAPATYPTNDPASGVSLNGTTSTVLSSIDTYWQDSRNRRWTGVWKNGNTTDVATSADIPANANPVAALQSWLISGNETTAAFTPDEQVANFTLAGVLSPSASTSRFGTTAKPYRLLVGPGSVHIDSGAPDTLDRAVVAPEVEIQSSGVPGTNGASTTVGHYAWWVGDEGVKARANLSDAYATTGTPEANRTRLQSAQRPAIEAITALAPFDPTAHDDSADELREFQATLGKIFSPSQLTYLSTAPTFPEDLKSHYHDLSVTSRGVLADVKNGGLKHDLSYLLTRPDLTSFRTALGAALPSLITSTPAAPYNRILSTAATPYATQPPLLLLTGSTTAFGGNSVSTGMDMFATSATWEQLWSYHNMGNSPTPPSGVPAGVFVDSLTARPRPHTGPQHGITPIIVQGKLFYKLRMDGNTLDADGVDRTSNIWIDIIPVLVLANPYSVALEAQDYILRSTSGNTGRVRLHHGLNPANPEAPDLKIPPTSNTNELTVSNGGLGDVKFTVKGPRMEPGRAYVFTLQNPLTTIPATSAAQQALIVNLVPDFNPANALTYNTTRKIAAHVAPVPEPPALPTTATHAALATDNGVISFALYTANYTTALGDQTLIRYVLPHTYAADSANNIALVYPLSSGLRHGGGLNFFIHDASNVERNQQNTTYQVNYRSLLVDNAAYTSFGSNPNGTGQNDIAISFARTRVKNGSTSLPGNDTPNDFIQAHLLWRDPADPTDIRWGIFNTGETDGTTVPSALVGDAGLVNILYDVPRADHPPSSIAQLAHFNTAGHIPRVNWTAPHFRDAFATRNHSFQPNLPIGNSYPNPMIIRQKIIDGDGGMGFQYDGSYLLNSALQDRFFFSTFPATGAFDFNDPSNKLINHRHRPFRSADTVAWGDPANFRTDSRSASKNLLVEGAFNINSTSVEAWKALLSSLKNIPVGTETSAANLTAPFARTLFQTGAAANSRDGNTVNAWTGTINLTTTEIDSLAREIVLQVRRRGPFLSMADFTNRRIIAASADASFGLGLGGALQAAIDRILNQSADVQPASLRIQSNSRSGPTSSPLDDNRRIAEDALRLPTGISGGPGYILQSDLLSTLGPALSARSDTFTIRTYGDAVNPATGEVTGRAWCEAIVQRTPDYIDTTLPDATPAPGSSAETFGRRYQIISFRWLTPDDI